ncbi:hypothetical protein FEM48_Zijuj11G0065600 [Ziziphus jujuba var. spinosa]|uniref:Disease resistance protein At4g27190-like leucine-rich repeats domain-containing protein n=1 Tax=Ziziphus jujuba var. spinosa TaxID=714518 RepID=A0A978UHD8_ZIZJJ|nr:hypothetical protein FEM48_Zijuj11G0065600 [Ziziphus jujuba var. spinosa]
MQRPLKALENKIFENIFSTKLPAAVVFMIEEAMKGVGEQDFCISALENVPLEAAKIEEADKIKSLARCGYEMLPSDNVAMIKCFWHSRELFVKPKTESKPESIHYNELITYWIMEGCFDPIDSIEKAYKKGHRILMELQRRRILKLQEDEFVSMERLAMDVPAHRVLMELQRLLILKLREDEFVSTERLAMDVLDRRRNGVSGAACLGLNQLTGSEKGCLELDLGRITLADGMIKSICNRNKWEKFTTLVMDGSRLHREVPKDFFKLMQELKILVLLKPRLESLDLLESLVLRILVLRDCEMLENIDHIKKLESLEVLEISGTSSLKGIPDEFFVKLTKLQSLNLSALPIKSLGTSFSKLTELRLLILRHCTCLEKLPSLTKFHKLEVLDLFGASSFKEFGDGELNSLLNFKMLDVSHTQIEKVPVLNNFRALTQLSLRNCKSLNNLRKLKDSSGLQILDLSGATSLIEVRNESLNEKKALRILDLSRTKISSLPSNLSSLSSLEVLDLSHMSCFDKTEKRKHGEQEIENEIDKIDFDELKCLRHLNLSNTNVKKLLSLAGLSNLRELLLMNCQSLEKLPKMEGLKRLEILDLSGSCLLGGSTPDMAFGSFGCLRRLNLSKTKVQKLLSLSDSLCELLLKDCELLKELPNMETLKRLEKLDLSGASSLEMIPERSFSQMSNLRQLLLPNCEKLCKLPALGPSEKLEVIDLSGCSALKEIEDDQSFEHIASLKQLKLSECKIKHLPSVSNLKKLNELVLGNCSNLEKLPSLESLSNLQQLDLSGAKFLKGSEVMSLEKMTKLRQLSLGNCSGLDQLPRLEKLVHLDRLDIQGITVKEFPYWISKLIHLKSLHLPDLKQIQELDWGKIKRLPNVLNWDECGIFMNPNIHSSSGSPFLSVSGTEIFRFINKIWDKCFKDKDKFHISVCSSTFSGKDEYIFCLRDEFQDFHFKTLSCPERNGGSMEIRGFDKEFPSGVEEILKQSIYIFLTENQFIKNLSDIGQSNIASMKGLWLESCGNMERLFCEKADIRLNQSLEILWVSHLVNLDSLYKGKVQDESFKNLKHLYINCCPKLENVFTPQQLPENLEILEIKFCDRLKTLFQRISEECVLEKLRELNLVGLPELSNIGIRFPSLQNIKVRNCPILEKLVDLDNENDLQQRIRECFGLVESARVEVYGSPHKDNLGICLMGQQTEPQNNLNSTPS